MEVKLKITYNQILRLIRQLPKKDIKKLSTALQSELTSDKPGKSVQKLILQAPTWTDSDLSEYTQARDHLNKSRIA